MIEWSSEQTNERTSKRAKWIIVCSEWYELSDWESEWMIEWMNEGMNKQTYEWMKQRTYKRANEGMNEW